MISREQRKRVSEANSTDFRTMLTDSGYPHRLSGDQHWNMNNNTRLIEDAPADDLEAKDPDQSQDVDNQHLPGLCNTKDNRKRHDACRILRKSELRKREYYTPEAIVAAKNIEPNWFGDTNDYNNKNTERESSVLNSRPALSLV
ncbi:MAG: hypothetical protein M1834_003360 [Cirrosporium novae-zelandiae]|nr:MAG: hypothetical protein M1834_003360 [Cirrosporium novae-zelandiae]